MKTFNKIVVDPFCMRQFIKNSSSYIEYDIKQFQSKANEYYQKAELIDGYAPFCKHVFIDNFANVLTSVLQITPHNENFLKSAYQARTQKQLPVLRRYFPKETVEVKPCKYLDLILYSKSQVLKQNQAMKTTDPNENVGYDFGIVSIKPSDVAYETPMDPITIMRNALGKQEGGSGVPLNRQKYLESVKYWSNHAIVK